MSKLFLAIISLSSSIIFCSEQMPTPVDQDELVGMYVHILHEKMLQDIKFDSEHVIQQLLDSKSVVNVYLSAHETHDQTYLISIQYHSCLNTMRPKNQCPMCDPKALARRVKLREMKAVLEKKK